MRDTFVRKLIEIAKKDKNVILITGDLGYGVLKPFWEQLPDQFINAGIAEQNMTGFSAGMALEGKTVFTYSIGNFPTLRCLEQIRNDCAYHNADVKIVCIGGGFAYGSSGMSHHATEDLAIMRALPNVTVMAPGDITETELATQAVYRQKGTCYLRLGKGGEKRISEIIENFSIGKAVQVLQGEAVAVFTTGAILEEAVDACKELNSKNIFPTLYSFPTVKPIDTSVISECTEKYKLIVTVEEHNIVGGFGSAVAEVMAGIRHPNALLIRLGLNDTYSCIVGNQVYLRNIYGISSKHISDKIENFLKGEQLEKCSFSRSN